MRINHNHLPTNNSMIMSTDNRVEHPRGNRDQTDVVHKRPAEIHLDAVEHAAAEQDEVQDCVKRGVQQDEAGGVHGYVGA